MVRALFLIFLIWLPESQALPEERVTDVDPEAAYHEEGDYERLRTRLETVLKQPEYLEAETPGTFGQMVNLVAGWLLRLNATWLGNQEVETLAAYSRSVMVTVFALSIALLVYGAFRYWQRCCRPHHGKHKEFAAPKVIPMAQQLEHIQGEKEKALAEARWVDALRLSWIVFLLDCEKADLLEPDHTLTNWECARKLQRLGSIETTQHISTVARAYDRHVFGQAPLTEQELQEHSWRIDQAARQLGAIPPASAA